MTLQEQYRDALLRRGETIVKRMSGGCLCMTRAKSGGTLFYYIGPSGSVRVGTTRGSSRPVSDQFKATLIAENVAANQELLP